MDALAGFERKDCMPCTADAVEHNVVWTGGGGGSSGGGGGGGNTLALAPQQAAELAEKMVSQGYGSVKVKVSSVDGVSTDPAPSCPQLP